MTEKWLSTEPLVQDLREALDCARADRDEFHKDRDLILEAKMRVEDELGDANHHIAELTREVEYLSGWRHVSDCGTNNGPALDPGPCDCALFSITEYEKDNAK